MKDYDEIVADANVFLEHNKLEQLSVLNGRIKRIVELRTKFGKLLPRFMGDHNIFVEFKKKAVVRMEYKEQYRHCFVQTDGTDVECKGRLSDEIIQQWIKDFDTFEQTFFTFIDNYIRDRS